MTFVASAKWPIALVHTNEERRVGLVVPVELELEVQHGYVQALAIEIDPTPPWVRRMMSFWSLRKQTDCKSRRLDQRQCQKSNYRGSRDKSQQEKSFQQDTPIEQKQETKEKEKEKEKKKTRKELKPENQIEATVHFWSRAFVQEIPRKSCLGRMSLIIQEAVCAILSVQPRRRSE